MFVDIPPALMLSDEVGHKLPDEPPIEIDALFLRKEPVIEEVVNDIGQQLPKSHDILVEATFGLFRVPKGVAGVPAGHRPIPKVKD